MNGVAAAFALSLSVWAGPPPEGGPPLQRPGRDAVQPPAGPVGVEDAPEPDLDAAFRLFVQGREAADEGRYGVALEFYARAYEITAPVGEGRGVPFFMAEAHRLRFARDGAPLDRRMAIIRYGEYLALRPDGEYAELAMAYNLALQADADRSAIDDGPVTRMMLSATARRARVRVDGEDPRQLPTIFAVGAGDHVLVFEATGFETVRRDVTVVEGETLQVDVELRELDGRVRISGPRAARVSIDGIEIGALPFDEPIPLRPGAHVIAVTRDGHVPFQREITVVRDEEQAVVAALHPTTQRVASYPVIALGGVGLAAGAVFAGLAVDRYQGGIKLEEKRLAEGITLTEADERDRLLRRSEQWKVAAIATGSAGVALLTTGLVLYFVDRRRAELPASRRADVATSSAPRFMLLPAGGPGGAGLVTQLEF